MSSERPFPIVRMQSERRDQNGISVGDARASYRFGTELPGFITNRNAILVLKIPANRSGAITLWIQASEWRAKCLITGVSAAALPTTFNLPSPIGANAEAPAASTSTAAADAGAGAESPKFSEVLSEGVQQTAPESLPVQRNRNDLPPAFRTQAAGRKAESLKDPRKTKESDSRPAYLTSTQATPQSIGIFAIGTTDQSESDAEADRSASDPRPLAETASDAAAKTIPGMTFRPALEIAFSARIRITPSAQTAAGAPASTPDAATKQAASPAGNMARAAAAFDEQNAPEAATFERQLTGTVSPDDKPEVAAPVRESSDKLNGRNSGVPASDPSTKDSRADGVPQASAGNARQGADNDSENDDVRKSTPIQTTAAAHTADNGDNTPFQTEVHVSTTDRSAAAPPQSASRPDPARAMEAPPTATPLRTTAARDIALQLPNPGGARVDVQLTDRGGDVRVVVRTEDTDLARDLRSNLPELSQKLSQSGMESELAPPVETHGAGGGHEGPGEHNRQAADDSQSPRGGSQDSSSSEDRRQQQQRREHADRGDAETQFSRYFSGVFQ